MADPRGTPRRDNTSDPVKSYKIDGSDITFDATLAGGSSAVGKAVMLSGNGVVRLAGDAAAVLGRLEQVEDDGVCAVRVRGAMTLPKGDGSVTVNTPIVGNLVTAARGYIRNANSAVAAETIAARGLIVDVSDTANVEVEL